jgi:uroporphyrin-III C-methyltransferase
MNASSPPPFPPASSSANPSAQAEVAEAAASAPAVPDASAPAAAPSRQGGMPLVGSAGSSQVAGSWFGTVMLVVALVALLLSGMLWQRLDRIQQELAKRSASVAEESEQSLETAHEAKAQVQELQARLTLAEVKLSEVSLQRTQLEELMLSVSRSRDDTLVLDIESGIRLAMQQAELTGSTQPLLSALQAATRRIDKSAQPRLNPVQRAMARDMDRIKASAVADLPLLAARLDELSRSVDEWVLTNDVSRQRQPSGKATRSKVAPGAAPAPEHSGAVAPSTVADGEAVREPVSKDGAKEAGKEHADASAKKTTAPAKTKGPVEPEAQPAVGWTSWAAGTAWVARWLDPVWQGARDLVRVSRIDEPEAVLLSPQQSVFLRENLKLRLLNVRLSLLSRQVTAARADMQYVKAALAKYFDPTYPSNKLAMQSLEEALQASRALDLPRPDDTLAALATAAGGR